MTTLERESSSIFIPINDENVKSGYDFDIIVVIFALRQKSVDAVPI